MDRFLSEPFAKSLCRSLSVRFKKVMFVAEVINFANSKRTRVVNTPNLLVFLSLEGQWRVSGVLI